MQFHYQKTGSIGRITMVNPPTNALIHPLFADKEELRSFFEDRNLKAVILRGGGRHFCSGADPEALAQASSAKRTCRSLWPGQKNCCSIISFAPIPVAAVITGSCLGGGLEIALACHFRFAATTAMFGFPECGHSLMPGMGGTVFPRQTIPRRHLIDLILSGRMIGAEEALQIGLVDFVSPGKKIGEEAVRFLESLTERHSPNVIRAVMRSIHNGRRLPMEEALAEETRLFCELAQDVVGPGIAAEKGHAMNRWNIITSVLVSLDIREVAGDPLLETYFSPEERAELRPRHIRSTAGSLALKRAVLHLLSNGKDGILTEKDIVLSLRPKAGPVLLSLSDRSDVLPGTLFLSISHTKSTAYGLAVLQEN